MPAAVFAEPLRAGSRADGEMLRVGELNAHDGFVDGVALEGAADLHPGTAAIDGMKQVSAGAPRPHVVANGRNCPELYASRHMDRPEILSAVRGALHFAIR